MASRDDSRQHLIRRNRRVTEPLGALVAIAATVLVYEVVRANVHGARHWTALLGVPTAASLLATGLVALIARNQYAESVRPLLRYESEWVKASTYNLDAAAAKYRQVRLRNVGPGRALLTNIRWVVGAASVVEPANVLSIGALRDALLRLDLREGRDYYVVNYSADAAMASDENELYFECTEAAVKAFAQFDAVLTFTSTVGDVFEKAVSLLPRPGASSAVLDAV